MNEPGSSSIRQAESSQGFSVTDWFNHSSAKISREIANLDSLDTDNTLEKDYQKIFGFLESQNSVCLILNAKAEIIYLNSFGSDLLGVSRHEYYGSCWLTQYILPDQRTEIAIVFEQMMKGYGESFSKYCNEIHTQNQSNITLEWQNRILKNSQKVILGSFSVGNQLGISK